jgi:hypothetical protein
MPTARCARSTSTRRSSCITPSASTIRIELELAAHTHRLLSSRSEAALAPFLAEWPQDARWRELPAHSLPVLQWLSEASSQAPRFSAELCIALAAAASALAWHQTYTAAEIDRGFLDRYGWCELVGGRGVLEADRIACGFLLLGPETLYPAHRHEAEELYLPLSGSAFWQQSDRPWERRPPGTLIRHASLEPHAMRTSSEPLLALYLWRGAGLAGRSRLDLS